MSLFQKLKDAFNGYLERLAKENKKQFGNSRPDCCSLNRQQSQNHSEQKAKE